MIPKDTAAEILRLYHGERWRIGTIASQLAIHHTTVQRVLKESGVETQIITPRPSMADPYLLAVALFVRWRFVRRTRFETGLFPERPRALSAR